MPSDKPQQSNPLLLIIIIGGLWLIAAQRSADKPVKPDPTKPDVVVPELKVKPTPDHAWNAFAQCVENKWIGGEMQQHTDHLVKIADSLKASGTITDISRVEPWRAKRIEITDANRAEIAKVLRGQ